MSESTDDGLLNEGVMITLAGGERRMLTVRNRHLWRIEMEYGSLAAFLQTMRNGSYFGTLSYLFALAWKMDQDDALDLIDGKRLMEYFEAAAEVIGKAIGATIEEEPAGEGERQAPNGSPGVVTLPSRSSAATSPRGTSGTR